MHVCFLATVPLLFFFANNAIRQGVEARIRESDNKTQLDAASSLLELTCDAVVQLDSDFRVISESTPLATMLFRRATTLKGTKFTELVAPSESVRAEELLRDCGGEVRMANAFHTHLVDSNASSSPSPGQEEMVHLNNVDRPGSDVDAYVNGLDRILRLKADYIGDIRSRVDLFKEHLAQEDALSRKFQSLASSSTST
eukprot:g7409.t1